MKRLPASTRFALPLCVLALSMALSACNLSFQPAASQPTVAAPANPEPIDATLKSLEIPNRVLTEVAATLYAPYQAAWTAQARPPTTSTHPTPTPELVQVTAGPIFTSGLPAQPTQEPKQTGPAVLPTAAITPLSTAADALLPTVAITPFVASGQISSPPTAFAAQTGAGFRITGLNLQACGDSTVANFLIQNRGAQTLESLSLHVLDLSTGLSLSGPTQDNAPFGWNDRVCAPGGINRLNPGGWLYAGGSLGPGRLAGHTLLASFIICTQDNLTGQCYPRTVEFVAP